MMHSGLHNKYQRRYSAAAQQRKYQRACNSRGPAIEYFFQLAAITGAG